MKAATIIKWSHPSGIVPHHEPVPRAGVLSRGQVVGYLTEPSSGDCTTLGAQAGRTSAWASGILKDGDCVVGTVEKQGVDD